MAVDRAARLWQVISRVIAYVWPGIWTMLGLAIVAVLRVGRAHVVVRSGTIGCYGGATGRLLRLAPISGGAAAITIGHVILAANLPTYQSTFHHEMVHVKQYERWGPFFIPAYLLASLWLLIQRKDYYRGNPFEKQAFEVDALRLKRTPPEHR